MPSFSFIIPYILLPRYAAWSCPIEVITQSLLLIRFVFAASNLPPKPVSKIVKSGDFNAKYITAVKKTASK